MFKCKQCGRQFGANTPKVCPVCGAESKGEDIGAGRVLLLGLLFGVTEVVFLGLVVIGLIAIAGWTFGWF